MRLRIHHDFSKAEETIPFEIPENAGALTLRLGYASWSPTPDHSPEACASGTASILIRDPSGAEYATFLGTMASFGGDCTSFALELTDELAPGTWQAAFTGQGLIRGIVGVDNE